VRPHPQNAEQWQGVDLPDGAAIWPAAGAQPDDESSRADFFDSIHHSAAVAGVNTSAMIDAAIVGRRTYSILLPQLRGAQEQTLHFHYLLPENGGALIVARSLEEHLGQLRALRSGEAADDGWRERFLTAFVRPDGLDEPVAPKVVADLERFASG